MSKICIFCLLLKRGHIFIFTLKNQVESARQSANVQSWWRRTQMMQLCRHSHPAKSSSRAFGPLNSHIDSPRCHSWLGEQRIDAWPLWSCMCLTAWAPEPVLDTGGTNYPQIMHCWQSVWGTERRQKDEKRQREHPGVALIACFRSPGFLMARLWHVEWCTRGSAAMSACALTIPFSLRCMFCPPFVIVCEKSDLLWNIRAVACSYLCTVMWLTPTTMFLFLLTDAWNSVAPWLHTITAADVRLFSLENLLWDRCHPNGATEAQPKDVLNMNTVKQVNNIKGTFDGCSVGGN